MSPGALEPRPVDQAEVADHLLVHEPRRRTLHALNPTARLVWASCTGDRDAAGVLQAVAAASGMDPADIADDVTRTIDDLIANGLLEPSTAGPEVPDPTSTPRAGPSPPGSDERAGRASSGPPPAPRSEPTARGTHRVDDGALVVRMLERTVSIHCPDAGVAARLADVLGAVTVEGPADHHYALVPTHGARRWALHVDDTSVRSPTALEGALGHLVWHLNHEAVSTAETSLLLHAGAVAGQLGVVAIAGQPDAGKSTLTAALVASGMAYVTDEATAIDLDDLRVTPYPKPISLDRAALDLLADTTGPRVDHARAHAVGAIDHHVAPDAIGRVALLAGPLLAVVLPDRHSPPDARPVRLDPVDAALTLGRMAFNLDRTRQRGLRALARVAADRPVLTVPTRDLSTAVAEVRAMAGGPPH